MAIKAIINNTEKEIEQIKNSDEQDIDYVYSRIGDTEVEGEPPISIKSIGGELADYRIYGNTVDGESVGDFVTDGNHAGEYKVPVTINDVTTNLYLLEPLKMVGDEAEYIDYGEQKQHRVRKNLWSGVVEQGNVSQDGGYGSDNKRIRSKNVPIEPGTYMISSNVLMRIIYAYNDDQKIGVCLNSADGVYSRSFTVPAGANNIAISMMKRVAGVQVDITPSDFIWGQIEKGSEATTYEPYITNTELDVTLPALSTIKGTNTLSVNTSIQPSNMYIKDNFDYKKVFTATRIIEGELPLNYRSIEDNDSTLSNYRIYGQTSRNLLQNTATSQTINGVTFTVNSDGSVTCNGTANNTTVFIIHNFPRFSGECILSGCPMNGSQNTYRLQYTNARDMSYKDYGTGCNIYQFDETQYPLSVISIRIENGYTCDNLTFYPMIRKADIEDVPYEPYGESVGDRTGNLWDEEYEDANIHYVPIKVEDGEYTLSTTIPNAGAPGGSPAANIFLLAGNVNSGASTVGNGCWLDNPKTVQSIDGYVTIAYKATESFGERCYPWNNKTMLNAGSIALPYEPYGYKVPVTVSNGTDTLTTPIYLPEQIKKVGDEAEYIDYGEQKQHRVRKNLLPKTTASYSSQGILVTSESDGTLSVNGIATGTIFLYLANKRSYPFDTILNGCPQGGSSVGYILRAVSKVPQVIIYTDFGNGVLIPANTQVELEIRVQNGTECNYLKFKPMIRKADIIDDTYEPYIENTDLDVTLPALPTVTGTNTLSVETEVKPSKTTVKGHIK